jgi:hypothetical protein
VASPAAVIEDAQRRVAEWLRELGADEEEIARTLRRVAVVVGQAVLDQHAPAGSRDVH